MDLQTALIALADRGATVNVRAFDLIVMHPASPRGWHIYREGDCSTVSRRVVENVLNAIDFFTELCAA